MFNLIPVSLLIGALGGILYIVSGHLSELNSEEEKNDVFGFNLKEQIAQYINQLPLDTIKSQSLMLTRKALHRFRLALLKTDNHLIKLIGKISQGDKTLTVKTNENDNIPDFWEKVAKPEEQIAAPAIETEVKIDFAVQDELPKKFLDIRPVKIYSEISEAKQIKKSLKKKKSLK